MPYKTESTPLKDRFLDRRVKLLPCQKEMVSYWYKVRGASINGIARLFRVNKRTIQFLLFPERLKRNKELRADRGGSSIYYDRDKHNQAIKSLRSYKNMLLKDIPPVNEQGKTVYVEASPTTRLRAGKVGDCLLSSYSSKAFHTAASRIGMKISCQTIDPKKQKHGNRTLVTIISIKG